MSVTTSSHASTVARTWPAVTSALVLRDIDSMLITELAKTSMNAKSRISNVEKVHINDPKISMFRKFRLFGKLSAPNFEPNSTNL